MVKCPRCGYDNPSASKYCSNCNYPLDATYTGGKNRGSWNIGLGKKIIIVLGIVVIAFLLFSFAHNHSQPGPEDSLNVIDANGSDYKSSTYPYRVNITYGGSWYAEMGDPNYLDKRSSEGSGMYTLDCASWDKIYINVQKTDYGEAPLKVQLIRNGVVVAENSTTDESYAVTLEYNQDT